MILYFLIWLIIYYPRDVKFLPKSSYKVRKDFVEQALTLEFIYFVCLLVSFILTSETNATGFIILMFTSDLYILSEDSQLAVNSNWYNFTFTNIACLWLPLVEIPGL